MSAELASAAERWLASALELLARTGLAWAVLVALETFLRGRRGPWPELRLAAWSALLCAPLSAAFPAAGSPLPRLVGEHLPAAGAERVPFLPVALLALWTGGVLVLELHGFARTLRLRRALARLPEAPLRVQRETAALARRLGLWRAPRVVLLPAGRSPLVFGLVRPTLGLPRALCTASRGRDRERALAHELAHLARRDPWIALLLSQLVVLAWPSPFAWHARRRASLAQELACDQRVLRLAPQDRLGYRAFLLASAARLLDASPPRALAFAGRPAAIRARLDALLLEPRGAPRLRSVAALCVLAGSLALLAPPLVRHAPVATELPGCLPQRFLVLGELARERGLAPFSSRPDTNRR